MKTTAFLIALLAFLACIGFGSAFQVGKPQLSKSKSSMIEDQKTFHPFTTTPSETTALFYKSQKPIPPEEKIQQTDAKDLFFTYMNPTRNPNSLFVYMLTALILLGKYSEARHIEQFGAY